MGELASEVGKGLVGDRLPALLGIMSVVSSGNPPQALCSLWVGSLAPCLWLWSLLSSVPLGPFCLLLVPYLAPALCFLLLRGPAGQHPHRADPLTLPVTRAHALIFAQALCYPVWGFSMFVGGEWVLIHLSAIHEII